jgi:hypothetical protein
MGLKYDFIKVNGNPSNLKYYRELGYQIENKQEITIKITDLSNYSKVKVDCVCDYCNTETLISYSNIMKTTDNFTKDYYCRKCSYIRQSENNLKKYGVKSTLSLETTKNKIKETNLEKYGTEHPSQSELVKNKMKQTNLERYGVEYSFQSDIIKSKINRRNLERYGDVILMKSDIVKNKMKKTVEYNENNKYRDIIPSEYEIIDYSKMSLLHNVCNKVTTINRKNVYFRLRRDSNLCDYCRSPNSKPENKLKDFIKSLNVDYIENDRTVLEGKELDIYIPSKNLAIEFNGLYWHSEKFLDKNYHLNKTNACQEKGIQLIHIFEDDWEYKQEIVKSIIKNRLNKIEGNNKIYARKCIVKEVKSNIVRTFLDENHIQGFSRSTYKLGLYYNDELVSLMTFGYRRTNTKKEFELIRFCNKLGINVIGASSKLFKYFLMNYSIEDDYILSYADYSLFNGKMYDMLGFKEIHLTVPNYFWVINKKREHRWKYNKQKLIKEGFDSNKTEKEIMYSRGYYRIYGVGQKRYEYYI